MFKSKYITALEEAVAKLTERVSHQEDMVVSLQNQLEFLKNEVAETGTRAVAAQSEVPDMVLRSSGISDEGEIYLELDWNPAFVSHLKANGYTGPEDEIVTKYIGTLINRLAPQRPDIIDNGIDDLQHERRKIVDG